MSYAIKPLSCDPAHIKGMSERLIVSHYENNYSGAVTIKSDGGGLYRMDWTVGSTRYGGTGNLEGNLLTVDWGGTTPAVYAVTTDGRLRGLWAAGRGEETLIPNR